MSKMLNVRVEPDLAEAIDRAAEEHGVTRSVWMREVLADACTVTVQPHSERTLQLQAARRMKVERKMKCVHPPTAEVHLPFSVVCGSCGATVRSTA